ncbi:type II toxin-antitoxin system HicA family toxin [Geitlerinema sp. CS-897]|nr:type II toxin-antitoxin system HicA family toxin [Geitlerinema sp. CS-897]
MCDKLKSKQRRTLEDIFVSPVRSDISWNDVENLLRALGADIREGRGSRVRCVLGEVRAVFHKPHPKPVVNKPTVKDLKRFLTNAGFEPDNLNC